jgi:hypothetical protein
MNLTPFIFYLGLLVFVAWIFQAIVLPAIRQKLRFELFRLRDTARELVIAGTISETDPAFEALHSRLNLLIRAIPAIDLALLVAMKGNAQETSKRAQKFSQLMESGSPEIKAIFYQAMKVIAIALVANSSLWFVWVFLTAIPIGITQGIWKVCSIVKDRVKETALPAFQLRERDLEYMPSLSTSSTSNRIAVLR